MKILLLSCSTGEGHNHCAKAVRNALESMGHQTDFFDMLHLFGERDGRRCSLAAAALCAAAAWI